MRKLFNFIIKNWWYLILLLSSSIFVYLNWSLIWQVKISEFNTLTLIFILWLMLLLLPLFSEIEIIGVKFKRELEKAKMELSQEIKDVRLDIINYKLSNNNNNTFNLGNDFLPNDDKLKEMMKELNNSTSQEVENREDEKLEEQLEEQVEHLFPIKFELPEENIFLFKVRSYLEQNLDDICNKFEFERVQNMREMIRFLNERELINGRTATLLTEIIKISSRGIHGEIISKEYISFILDTLPEVERIFESIKNRIEYFVCPRCKYSGFTQNTNRCPKCGFNSDDY